jgi:splicing factor 45
MQYSITDVNILFSAVVDLNGRFFGGRQVKAGFYSWEKLNNLELLD